MYDVVSFPMSKYMSLIEDRRQTDRVNTPTRAALALAAPCCTPYRASSQLMTTQCKTTTYIQIYIAPKIVRTSLRRWTSTTRPTTVNQYEQDAAVDSCVVCTVWHTHFSLTFDL